MTRHLIALALAAALLAAAAPAASAQTRSAPRFVNPLARVLVIGDTQRGRLSARFDVDRFEALPAGGYRAVGELRGTLADRRFPVPQRIRRPDFALPVALSPAGPESCARLGFTFGSLTLRVESLRTVLRERTVRVGASRGPRRLLTELLCGINGAVAAAPPEGSPAVARLLTALRAVDR